MTVVGYCSKCGGKLGTWPLGEVGRLVHITDEGRYVYRDHRPLMSDLEIFNA